METIKENKIMGERADEKAKEEINEMLSKINFDILESVLSYRLKELGCDISQLNFLTPKEIDYKGRVNALATYDSDDNTIHLNKAELGKHLMKKEGKNRFLEFLHIFIHEEIHSASFKEFYYYTKEEQEAGYIRRGYTKQSGYKTIKKQDCTRPDIIQFESFNEAITERLTDEIICEYAKKSNLNIDEIEKFLEQKSDFYRTVYIPLLELFVEIISTSKKVNKDEVWNEFFKGLIEGKNLFTDSLTSWTNKVFGKNFIERLSYVDRAGETIKDFSTYLNEVLTFIRDSNLVR